MIAMTAILNPGVYQQLKKLRGVLAVPEEHLALRAQIHLAIDVQMVELAALQTTQSRLRQKSRASRIRRGFGRYHVATALS